MIRQDDLPSHKECRACGQVKPKSQYGIRKQLLKSGRFSFYLESECKKCANERTSKYYHEVRKHQLYERPHEKRQELQVSGEPILKWLETHEIPSYIDQSIKKRFNDLREGRAFKISIDTIDRFLIQIDSPELLNEWYPIDI